MSVRLRQPQGRKWEYLVAIHHELPTQDDLIELQTLGDDRWELVSVTAHEMAESGTPARMLYFKREVVR